MEEEVVEEKDRRGGWIGWKKVVVVVEEKDGRGGCIERKMVKGDLKDGGGG